MGTRPNPQARRGHPGPKPLERGTGQAALLLALLPVLLLAAGDAWAAGPGPKPGIGGSLGFAKAVQPTQYGRGRFIAAGKLQQRRIGRLKGVPTKGTEGSKDASNRPPRDPPSRRPPRRPHRPHFALPLPIIPDTPEGRAEYLSSLPRRAQQTPQGQAQAMDRQIVVLFSADRSLTSRDGVARAHGLERLRSQSLPLLDAQLGLFRIRGGRSEAAVLAALRRDGRVRAAQANLRYFNAQGALTPAAAIPQYGPIKVGLPEAHQLALGRKVTVAVIDSSVDAGHPDLKGAIVRSFDAARGEDAAPAFHGTAVAGLIRGRGIVAGAAPEAEILAVRAFRISRRGALAETDTFTLLSAIDWSVRNGARILNMSFTGPHDAAVREALETAGRKGVVLIAAAGNGGPKAPAAYPAAYPGVIAVTAVDATDQRYQHANRGGYIAVAAPGVDILAPVERGRHSYLSGTSLAAAYVSGIAALLLEHNPNLGAPALAELIAKGADDLGPAGRDEDFGAGRVNARTSLRLLASGVAAR
jgi:subtilisin family serine protease